MLLLGEPCLLVGDFNVKATKIPCLTKAISAGLWVDFEEAWASAAGLRPTSTCKRDWSATGGHRTTLWLVAPLLLLLFSPARFSLTGGLLPILRFGLFLTAVGGSVGLLSLFSGLPSGLPLGCLLLTKK